MPHSSDNDSPAILVANAARASCSVTGFATKGCSKKYSAARLHASAVTVGASRKISADSADQGRTQRKNTRPAIRYCYQNNSVFSANPSAFGWTARTSLAMVWHSTIAAHHQQHLQRGNALTRHRVWRVSKQ
ncbi:hypothetical protein ACFIQF_19725 [Comamonas sp. J-3]|jgi:hypothetical protein|uniref:hypothetical protein n=1 Tax=Comamonas trifloxystrobinivorans TaxID=3350256 RepID=UPI0037293CA3